MVDLEIPQLVVYRQTDQRVDWNDPTRAQLIKSANDAHSANRKIIDNCDRMRVALLAERRGRRWLFRGLLATWTVGGAVLGFTVKFLLPWAIKGMAAK